jgi:hypothetical protein
MSKLVSATVCTCVLLAIGSIRCEPEPFTVDCQLPFESIKKHHPTDDNCPATANRLLQVSPSRDRRSTFPRNLEADFTHYLCEQRKEVEIYERSRRCVAKWE